MGERRGTKALELWCRRMTDGYPGVEVVNMTTSWRDGLAFCAMIHHFRPDLIEFDKLNKADVYYNNDLAFRTAERHLGIPALLDADDMASYEVPDRLSILTYLSQFYQVFASQDSPNRLNQKRTSTASEKTSITKPSGPPPKMAHVVGVPKRDPCQKCALPVFLAERLTIGKRVYHRTCLKCARCSSQLTPGSFYETEVDGEYCCETCPDEEKSISDEAVISIGGSEKETLPSASAAGRGSIASRLAFFENDGKKLLQKSLSDEEKSQSLKKITETQMKNVYKHNSALSHFMSSHLSDTADGASSVPDQSNDSSRRNSGSTITSTTSDTNDEQSEDHQVPDLPTSLPPAAITTSTMDTASAATNTSSASTHKPKTYESTLTLSFDTVNSRSLETSTPIAKEPSAPVASDNVEQIAEEKKEEIEEKLMTPSTLSTEKSTTDLNLNDKMNVTKDISDTDEKMRTTTKLINTTAATTPTIATKSTNLSEPVDKFDEISQNNRSSMVRARLHQFEIISNNTSPSTSNSSNSSSSSISSKAIKSVCDEKLSSASTIVDTNIEPKPLETEVPKIVTKDNNEDASFKNNSNTIKETEDASYRHDEEQKESQLLQKEERKEEENQTDKSITSIAKRSLSNANLTEEYPEDLNPFKSDEENNEVERLEDEIDSDAKMKIEDEASEKLRKIENRKSLNPFDSSDEENEETDSDLPKKIKPPRPPPPKISTNPFGSDDEEDAASLNETPRRMPVPTPRSHVSTSQNATPEPTPRLSRQRYGTQLNDSDEYYGSHSSLTTHALHASTEYLKRGGDARGSSHSIGSSTGSLSSGKYKKAKKAPAPPKPPHSTIKELFPPSPIEDRKHSPASSVATTPQPRKKRPAPAPPPSAEKVADTTTIEAVNPIITASSSPFETDDVKVAEDKLSDEEKLKDVSAVASEHSFDSDSKVTRRLISVDASLLDDTFSSIESRPKEEDSVVYRRTIAPLVLDTSTEEEKVTESHDRQLEKLKDNKEAKNRNRQSQISLPSPNEENDPLFNKSVHGKWKRRKGPAPALPVPPKKVLQMLPLQEIRHELEIIEVQQQGLEKQGVMLEKMIRERCEGDVVEELKEEHPANSPAANSKEVEDLILQLFELVNEKNELFRRQAELMYLRRQHRLEQEQADLEYEIRVLMAQPERNKTDSDKAREETMIARLVEVVQLRNEVIDCLEMDRLREAEEDMSIKQRLEMHTAKRDEELCNQTPTKLSKKEKKRQKESKKLGKSKKLDADKDADESELSAEKKEKKKKKNLLSSVIPFK